MAHKIVVAVGDQESKQRIIKCFSTYRDNIPSDDMKKYWRRTTPVPVMDNLTTQFEGRLRDRQHTDLFIVLPSVMLKCDIGICEKKLEETGIFYSS